MILGQKNIKLWYGEVRTYSYQ